MKRWLWLLTLLLIVLTLSGCGKTANNWQQNFSVVPGTVSEVKKQPQPKFDVYVPLMDQFANSKHAVALETLNKAAGHQPACYNCHSAEYRLAPANAKPNIKQLSTSVTCIVCHTLTPSGFELKTSPLETCTQCHTNGSPISAGQAVKHDQKEMFTGTGALDVPDMPSTKYKAGLTCIECHMPNQSHTFEALTPAKAIQEKVGHACMMCHTKLSPEQFAAQVTELQQKTESKNNSLKQQLIELKAGIDAAQKKGRKVDQVQKLYDTAFTDESFVEADGSKGVHNFEYADAILTVAQNKVKAAQQMLVQ